MVIRKFALDNRLCWYLDAGQRNPARCFYSFTEKNIQAGKYQYKSVLVDEFNYGERCRIEIDA